MSQDCVDSAVVSSPEEFLAILPKKRTCAKKNIACKPFEIRSVIRNVQQLRKWSIQVFTIKEWFPLCEYVLKMRGVEYVKNVCSKHPI